MAIGEVGESFHRSGSGVILDAIGDASPSIATSAHFRRSGDLTVELWDGILGTEAGRLELEPAHSDDSRRIRVGEVVIAVGNPLGFTGVLSTAVIHGVGPVHGIGAQDFIQTTVRLAPGNSGGPLADACGNPATAVRRLQTGNPPVELGLAIRPVRIPAPNRGIALLALAIAPGSPADYPSLRPGDLPIGAFHPGQRETTVRLIRGIAA
jgi:serine protease Do